MEKLIEDHSYDIQGIKNESYHDCKFIFGPHFITAVDGQYFQTTFGVSNSDLNEIWWDSEGFKITKIR